ncbi:MAG: segregation/condensation protein A, partial [Roseibium sp.]|nr:segregation/condensation protein A [Roseibium sp.]
LYDNKDWATIVASTFCASLEMVREGQVEIRQGEPFSPVYIRSIAQEADHDGE